MITEGFTLMIHCIDGSFVRWLASSNAHFMILRATLPTDGARDRTCRMASALDAFISPQVVLPVLLCVVLVASVFVAGPAESQA